MAKLREPDHLPAEALRCKERIAQDSHRYPAGQCPKCPGRQFQRHARRSRWFLAVVDRLVYPLLSVLWRWRCVACGTTFTHYSAVCVPGHRYLRAEFEQRPSRYLEELRCSYRHVVKNGPMALAYAGPLPAAQASEAEKEQEATCALAPSTVHRWISAIAARREHFQPVVQQAQERGGRWSLAKLLIPWWKYRSPARQKVLEACGVLLRAVGRLAVKTPTEFATLGSSP